MKVIFVGDKPSPRMKPGAKPFEGAACQKRLMEWIEFIDPEIYVIVNSVDIGVHEGGLLVALACLKHWPKDMYYYTHIIALGDIASKALKGIPHFKLPHPSGRNRQINNKEFIKKQLELAKEYINEKC